MTSKLIVVDDEVHAELKELGKKGESYKDVIVKLINCYKKNCIEYTHKEP